MQKYFLFHIVIILAADDLHLKPKIFLFHVVIISVIQAPEHLSDEMFPGILSRS